MAPGKPFAHAVRTFKRQLLLGALADAEGNITLAAITLGIHRNVLYYNMRDCGITQDDIERALAERVRGTKDAAKEEDSAVLPERSESVGHAIPDGSLGIPSLSV